MVSQFPPSSPIAGSSTVFGEEVHHESSSEDFYGSTFTSNNSFMGKPKFARSGGNGHQFSSNKHQYPTPQASSSTGRSSSPIRAVPFETITVAPSELKIEKAVPVFSPNAVNIELDPYKCSRLAIGRKKSVCDIVLPSKKNISRQHAFISYIPIKDQVKIECNGTNGLVITLPYECSYDLIKKDSESPAYELRAQTTEDFSSKYDQEVENKQKLTSFVLLKGECVLMPLVVGTLIDFRQAEAVLNLKQYEYSMDEDDNSTETEDEIEALMTRSDDFHEGSNTPERFIKITASPSTLKISERKFEEFSPSSPIQSRNLHIELPSSCPQVTPFLNESTPEKTCELHTPVTPKKTKHLKEELFEANQFPETPVTKNRTLINKFNESVSEVQNTDEPKRKQRKKDVTELKTSNDPISALEERGINCIDLQHVLANHLAFANVQQTPLFQLQEVNSKTAQISRTELRALLAREPCIGVIHREGKDAAGKPLDEEYYYDVENDSDEERRNLVTALKGGRSGLRSCRRTHKQYFWKKPAK